MDFNLHSFPSSALKGTFLPPGDKSISHRAIILGSLAEGATRIERLLEGEDVLRTIGVMRRLGVAIHQESVGVWSVTGVGLDGLREPDDVLDFGNSGTGIRLMAGVLASQPFLTVLTGDASLRQRPMGRVVQPLTKMGAHILGRQGGRLAPLVIQGGELTPMDYESPVASAQVKTAVLLAGLNTPGQTSVLEPALSRDHTERMLTAFGGQLSNTGTRVTVQGRPSLRGQLIQVPGDFSAAAFLIVAALLVKGSEILLRGVGINPTRIGLLTLLRRMGGRIEIENERMNGGEPVADLRIFHSKLSGIQVPVELIAQTIDEFPIFFIAAAVAEGETVVTEAQELRVKESDRLAAMAEGLRRFGVTVEERPDGMSIVGCGRPLAGGCIVDSFTDHRVAMSFLVAGLVSKEPVTVLRCGNINTSFPTFVQAITQLGGSIVPKGI
ncbi:MAG: 3-phosphoshikimate 1-carboxyvinyltransferase [Magnetococcus sp. DMHC-6]